MSKNICRVWTFESDSNPNIEYETLQYVDETTSCSCKGWTRRVAPDGSRSCKHTRYVDMGTADYHCKSTHSYEPQTQRNRNNNTTHEKQQIRKVPKLGQRKFAV